MIDTVMNLLFRCSHRRLTRPVTPVSRAGVPHGDTYVVCLECGKQFTYDLDQMRIGKPIETSLEAGMLPPEVAPKSAHKGLKFALWASVALVIGSAFKSKKRPREQGAEAK
jgi:DNA-directed RNA polymerase subunit RPC12/RpoP